MVGGATSVKDHHAGLVPDPVPLRPRRLLAYSTTAILVGPNDSERSCPYRFQCGRVTRCRKAAAR
jgi:hypothetical protein